ncbi:serine/threonine-protein kinase ATR [Argentina anserina]|uniref:serine/threonine-protein kinase ATR n=1 Tax=Argentina anserina TaxID=57926 RepID=UPI0021763AFC|nr:serine/threonine-protein kinase ATR [Potentilla anserina]
MSNLRLIHELRERIAAATSSSPNNQNDAALENRFRAVLPNLLHAHVVPSPTASEREVIAILRLIGYTAKHFPGVFYHGKAGAILPMLGRILAFFAEPAFRSKHGVIFETLGPLLTLLRSGAQDAYRYFFMDCMLVVQDLFCVASVNADKSSFTESSRVTLKCFCESFNGILDDPSHLGDLPDSIKPVDDTGILIDLTGNTRWQPFATWMIKLIGKCLTEGTLYVDGLVNMPFVMAACSLLCYGDADLHVAIFEFARIIGSATKCDVIPYHNMIQSISSILSEDKDGTPAYRNAGYDSSMGGCLEVLHSNCPDGIVKLTAAQLVNVFPHSMRSTQSQELKVALCNTYIRIAKMCPPYIWRPESLVYVLSCPEPSFSLIDCLHVALSILGSDVVGGRITDSTCRSFSSVSDKPIETSHVGEKRPIGDVDYFKIKRQKIDEKVINPDSNSQLEWQRTHIVPYETEDYANRMHKSLLSFAGCLKSPGISPNSLGPDLALTALSILCIAFCRYPETYLSLCIFHQMYAWIPWICQQAKEGSTVELDISIYLEGIHCMLCLRNCLMMKCMDGLPVDSDLILVLLKLPWTHPHVVTDRHQLWKIKCISLQVACKLGRSARFETQLEVLDLGLNDECEEVIIEAIHSMPVIAMWSSLSGLSHVFRRLELLGQQRTEKVKKIIPFCIGFLSCLYGSHNNGDDKNRSRCKFFFKMKSERHSQTVDLLQGFWCSMCDRSVQHNTESYSNIIDLPENLRELDCNFHHLQSLYFELLNDESSEEVQVACVKNIRRVLVHGGRENLLESRVVWITCVKYILINSKKAIREAFCTQISSFIEGSNLSCLFPDEGMPSNGKEQGFLNIINNSFSETADLQIFETLLESTAEIMIAVDIQSPLFLLSLLLLVDQLDNPHATVRMIAAKLIHKSCCFHLKGGLQVVLLKVVHVRNELFDFLSSRLSSRPTMVQEFAESVLGIETEDLVKKMVPVVLPKLVVSQQNDDQAVGTLYELAKWLNTDVAGLIVLWVPKVLAFALHQRDLRELQAAVLFYHTQIGSNKKEIFAAALNNLLDELICFLDGGDSDDISGRLARVPEMVKEVARVLDEGEDLPNFLRNHFAHLLNSIDRKMLHAEEFSLQKQALQRIEMLIKMMGRHLSTYVPKLMVLLMHAIDKELLQSEGLSVLHFFVGQLVKVSPASTKHVISQVFAALIPFLERDDESPAHLDKVVQILEELVLNNRYILKEHIREFPPLPSIPALTEVNKALQEARGSMTLRDRLRDIVDGLNHDSLNVRYMVVCELKKLLNLEREGVTSLITAEAGADMEILSSLIRSLLKGCAEESRRAVGQRLKLVCADCLGALGAVDPAKLKAFSCQRFKIECSDDDLIYELIQKQLARAFRAAPDTIIQDSAVVAIQELLKIAGCEASLHENTAAPMSAPKGKDPQLGSASGMMTTDGKNEMTRRGQRLWDRFSDYVKEIIAPYLSSRFQLPNVADPAFAGPIYRPSMSFRRWIFFWIRKLTTHATGSRARIFNACRGIVRQDMQTAIYLLPYLVLNAVCHGTEEARDGITQEILYVLDVAASHNSEDAVHGVNGGKNEVCIQAVFILLDNLGQWADDVRQELFRSFQLLASKQQVSKTRHQNQYTTNQDQLRLQCEHVSKLLSAVPKETLARASFRCQAYARSFMYYELYVREKSGSFNPASEKSGSFDNADVAYLMEIYSCLDEPDGLSGFAFLRKSWELQDQLLINKKAGNWAEVLTSCEQALHMEPTSVQKQSDVLNCLLNMCHLQAMVTHVDGLMCRIPQYKKTWCMQGVQAAWRLGRWDLMDEYLSGADGEGLLCSSSESNASFDMDVAKILQAMITKDQFSVEEKIALSKQALIAPLSAAGMDSYVRAYPFVVKLHLLRELEDFYTLLGDASFLEKSFALDDPKFSKVRENWENRLRFTQPSLWAREPLLAFRRMVFANSGLDSQVGSCWLQYAKLCRMAGHFETANQAILEAQVTNAPNVHMEKAKLLWSTRRSDGAIAQLQQCLLNMPEGVVGAAAISSITSLSLVPQSLPPLVNNTQAWNENRDIAKTLLLYSRWIHYTGQKQKEDVISLYNKVRELQPKWEKGYFYLAKYYEEVLADARKRQEENMELGSRKLSSDTTIIGSSKSNTEKAWWAYVPDILIFYAKGLHRGHKNLFQALPRLLTLWFDFGTMYESSGKSTNRDLQNVHKLVIRCMRGCLKDLPTYQWLTVLPQLVSRICHQNKEVVQVVKNIITSVLWHYPQQALWIMAAVSKSTVPSRREAAAEILQEARKGFIQGASGSNLFAQFASMIDHFIKLCFHACQTKVKTINISTEFSLLKRMMPLGIIMPIQQSLTVSLPTCDGKLSDSLKSDIFSATDLPTISGIRDEAEILSSLQRPKKIVLLGSDGIERPFLCKPKDDLRKDARMMEFTAMINRLLSKYPASRRRKLYIRTFAVIPLTEDCGMIEWVPHTRGLRQILQDIYMNCGNFDRDTNPKIKRIYDQCKGKIPEEDMLKDKILPMFPPVFHKWFLTTFSEPAAWFRARVAYAHTTAVWSMVGHIVGLGDRHGENILFDSTTGDCVHVDFSCLFDKGLQLEKPELVPFRLTQNMIDGLGIIGYEGIFLKICEITLSVLRMHRETLMSVLETFVHDPLVEWTKSHKSSGVEVQNPHAQLAINNIEARLQGVVVGVGAAPSLPLAVEGQARRLISEAVSQKNLGKMYIWWMPWF